MAFARRHSDHVAACAARLYEALIQPDQRAHLAKRGSFVKSTPLRADVNKDVFWIAQKSASDVEVRDDARLWTKSFLLWDSIMKLVRGCSLEMPQLPVSASKLGLMIKLASFMTYAGEPTATLAVLLQWTTRRHPGDAADGGGMPNC